MPTKPGTYATFKTSEGTIVCELFEKDAPQTASATPFDSRLTLDERLCSGGPDSQVAED